MLFCTGRGTLPAPAAAVLRPAGVSPSWARERGCSEGKEDVFLCMFVAFWGEPPFFLLADLQADRNVVCVSM